MPRDTSPIKDSQKLHNKKSKDNQGKREKTKRKRQAAEDEHSIATSPPKKHRTNGSQAADITHLKSLDHIDSPTHSPFHQQTFSFYLTLSPICQSFPVQGLCAEHLSPLLLTYYPPFSGVILSYSNARLTEEPQRASTTETTGAVLAKSVDEYAVSFVWLTADFLVFKPQKGRWVEGWINLQNESHVGLVCWNLFNASIEAKQLPKDWKWIPAGNLTSSKTKLKRGHEEISAEEHQGTNGASQSNPIALQEDEGHFEDADGKRMEGSIRFRVKDVETSSSTDREKSFLSIVGTLLGVEEEAIREEAVTLTGNSGVVGISEVADYMMSGALSGSQLDGRVDRVRENVLKSKHRMKY
ncbi:hypothetical protein MMC13_005128 [Lambiella insularis]|nr:hypothetical protein [Lambiella insularis]